MSTKQVVRSFIEELKCKIQNLSWEIPQFKALLQLYKQDPLAVEELTGLIKKMEKSRACCLINLAEANRFLKSASSYRVEPNILEIEN